MKNELSARLTKPVLELSVTQSLYHGFPMVVFYEADLEEAARFDFPKEKASGHLTVYVERSGSVKAHASDGCFYLDACTVDGYGVRIFFKVPDQLTDGDRVKIWRRH